MFMMELNGKSCIIVTGKKTGILQAVSFPFSRKNTDKVQKPSENLFF
jgi:hypothetical protein